MILNKKAITEIDALSERATRVIDNDTAPEIAAVLSHIPALCATVKQLREANQDLRSEMDAFKQDREGSDLCYMRQVETVEKAVARVAAERDDLQSQLEQLRAENEKMKKVVDAAVEWRRVGYERKDEFQYRIGPVIDAIDTYDVGAPRPCEEL